MRSAPSIPPESTYTVTQSQAVDLLLELESAAFEGRIGVIAGADIGSVELQAGNILRAQYASKHGREALLSILSAHEGKWILEPGAVENGLPIVASVSTLLTRGESSQKYWNELCANAPPMAGVLRLSDAGVRIRDAQHDPLSNLLQLIDGRLTLSLVLESSRSDPVVTLEQVIDAVARGLVLAGAPRTSLFPLAHRELSTAVAENGVEGNAKENAETGIQRKRPDNANRATSPRIGNSNAAQDESIGGLGSSRARRFVGRYEILTRIGHGGMGTVYLCRSQSELTGFRRHFALKLLRSHLCDDEHATLEFLSEARVAGVIHHANVVGVLDAGFHEHRPYLVMDYVEGCSLRQLTCANSGTPTRLLIPVVLDALAGLHAVHSLADDSGAILRLVHCDVSPENLLVGVDGICRLTDFGISRRTNYSASAITQGKLGYLAPEQLAGHSFDQRADIFAMGVVLWNALTGCELFAGYTLEQRMAASFCIDFPAPSTAGATCSSDIDEIVLRALAVNRSARYDSAEDVLVDLRAAALRDAGLATTREIADWVRDTVGDELALRRLTVLDISRGTGGVSRDFPSSRIPLPDPSSIQNIPIPLTRISSYPPALDEREPCIDVTPHASADPAHEGKAQDANQGAAPPAKTQAPNPEVERLFYAIDGLLHTDLATGDASDSSIPFPKRDSRFARLRPKQSPSGAIVVGILFLACVLGYALSGYLFHTPANEGTTVGSPKK